MPTFQGFKSKSPPPVKEVCQLNIDWSIVCLPSGPTSHPMHICFYSSLKQTSQSQAIMVTFTSVTGLIWNWTILKYLSGFSMWCSFWVQIPVRLACYPVEHESSQLHHEYKPSCSWKGEKEKEILNIGSTLIRIHLTATSAKFCPILFLFLQFPVDLPLLICLKC